MSQPPLKPLHPASSFSTAKLGQYDKLSTEELVHSLKPGQPGSLKVRPDGTVLDGHHRLRILRARGVDVDSLPREVLSVLN
ncbi:MAG: hypothetical protein HYZ50_11285 [Deltaproteobacteria bacterium]|nr:hypothetical protein [Deltaproteobacteria bacterium]